MTNVSRFAAHCAASKVVSSPELTALFLDRADLDDLLIRRVATPPRLPDVEKLVAKHGYRLAAELACTATDPQVLAMLAKNSSVTVLREVAANKDTDQATVEALWQSALRSPDSKLLMLLIPRVDPRTVSDVFDVANLEPDRLFPSYVAKMYQTAEPPWIDRRSSFVVGSEAFRVLREASDELRAEAVPPLLASVHVRAALEAAAMCAAGAVPGVSAVEAFERFVDSHPVLDGPTNNDRYVSATAACLRHMALCPDVTIGAELAELLRANADVLVSHSPFNQQNGHTVPLFGDRVTSEAFEVFRRCDVDRPAPAGLAELLESSWLSLAAPDLARELDKAPRGPMAFIRVLEADPSRFTSQMLHRAIQVCSDAGRVPDIVSRLAPGVHVDDDQLAELLRDVSTRTLVSFLTGELPVVPTSALVARLFEDNAHRLYMSSIASYFPDWKDQPWADALLAGLGPVILDLNGRSGDAVVGLFHDAFGTDPEKWRLAFDLLQQGFPGSLPELFDMVRTLAPSVPPTVPEK